MVGLKEYIGANPALHQQDATTVVHSKIPSISMSRDEYENAEFQEEFYDAIASESSTSDEESDEDEEHDPKVCLNLLTTTIKSTIEMDFICV